MKFFVPVILVAALGAAAWIALRPVEVNVPPSSPRAAPVAVPEKVAAGSETAPTTRSKRPRANTPRARTTKGTKPPPTVRHALRTKPGATTRYENPTTSGKAGSPATTTAGTDAPARKWGRRGNNPLAKYPMRAVKDGFRRYYANLPKSGRMPSRIELDEIMPRDLIERLNLPTSARVTEIGSWSATSPEGLKEILAIDPKTQGTMGFSVEVDGETYREYIELTE